MDRIVYLGPYNNRKKTDFFHKSIEYLKENKGDRFYYILPNGNLLVQYRKAMIKKVEKTLDINLFTFDDIADKLIEKDLYLLVNGDMKEVLLTQILEGLKEKGKLKYYKDISNKKGFIKTLSSIIGDIKQSLLTPEDYMAKCPNQAFYREIGLIYEEYERIMEDLGLIDREGTFFKSLENLKKDRSIFNNLDFILIDEFFDFRIQEWELLKEISQTSVPIYINMPFYRENSSITLEETLDKLKGLSFQIEYVDKDDYHFFEEVGSKLFTNKEIQGQDKAKVTQIVGANDYLEVKKIGEKIKYHYRQGVKLEDMALVLSNNKYKKVVSQVFQEEGIPLNMEEEISLWGLPLVKELVGLLELKNKMDKKALINRIRSKYFNICNQDEMEALEYILRKTFFSSLDDLKNSQQLLASSYGSTIDKVIGEIRRELELIPEKGLIEEYIQVIEELINKFNPKERIIETYKELGDYDLLHRDLTGLEKLISLLGEMKSFSQLLPTKLDLGKFLKLMENYFKNQVIIERERNNQGINILSPTATRGLNYKIIFMVGMSQDNYPNLLEENFFFREKNYKELVALGIGYKSYYENLDKESLIFSIIVASCTQHLYLSYSENASEDEKEIASIFLDEVIEKLGGNRINTINVNIGYLVKDSRESITTERELTRYLIKNYNNIDIGLARQINSRLICELERSREGFNHYSGKIGDENIVKDIKNLHRNKKYSISYLESYGKCSYAFLLGEILEVDEMDKELIDFSPLDRGIVIHHVLKNYYTKYQDEIKKHILGDEAFNIDESYQYIVDSVTQAMKAIGLETSSGLGRLRIENSASNILNFIKADLDRMSKYENKILPLDYELEFGQKEVFYIEKDGDRIPLVGRIDRIDKYVHEDKYIIIDYKNTAYKLRNDRDIINGLSLQLPVYIMGLGNKEIVAAAYGIVSKGEIDFKLINKEEKELIGRKRTGIFTREEIEELLGITKDYIIEYIDRINQGDFSINPKECSPYCIYKDVCRYEEKLEI